MKTKSIFLSITILFVSATFVFSQKTQFAIQGGVNMQNITGKDFLGSDPENSLIPGFHAGFNLIVPVAQDIYFQPGLLYSTKGSKNTLGAARIDVNLSYIELPLNLLYRSRLGGGKILLGFGPYAAYALSGNTTIGEIKSDIEFKNTVESGDPIMQVYMKAFDAGAGVYAGYETSVGLFLQLNTQLGLLKINPEDKRITNDKASLKNTGFGLSLGYRF